MSTPLLVGILIGLLAGLVIGLLIARFIPQKMDIGIGLFPMQQKPHDDDPSEAWKEKS